MDFSGIGAPGQGIIEGAKEAIETSSSIVQRGEGRLLLGNADAFDSNSAREHRIFTHGRVRLLWPLRPQEALGVPSSLPPNQWL